MSSRYHCDRDVSHIRGITEKSNFLQVEQREQEYQATRCILELRSSPGRHRCRTFHLRRLVSRNSLFCKNDNLPETFFASTPQDLPTSSRVSRRTSDKRRDSPDKELHSLSFGDIGVSLPLLRFVEIQLRFRSGGRHEELLIANRVSVDDIDTFERILDRFEIIVITTDEFDFQSFEERLGGGGGGISNKDTDVVACFSKSAGDGST